jgi:hypothetical protein
MSAKKKPQKQRKPRPPTREEAATIAAVLGQAVRAYGAALKESLADPMLEVSSDAPFLAGDAPAEAIAMRSRLLDRMTTNGGSGQRFDRAMKQPGNKRKAEVLFLSLHLSLDGSMDIPVDPFGMTGLVRYTDEACAALLNHWLALGTESPEAWDADDVRNLRRKYGIEKMPKRFLVSKVIGVDGIPISGR